MDTAIQLAIAAIEGLLPIISNASSGQVQGVINFLELIIPKVVQLGQDLYPSIRNIITALQSNGSVTADQITQLQTQSDALDAALDAAAKDDGLTGV